MRGRIVAVGDAGTEVFVLAIPSLTDCLPDELTQAEREVASLLLDGKSNRDIARARGTSVRTIANQIGAIFRKVDVHDRVELGHSLLGAPKRKH